MSRRKTLAAAVERVSDQPLYLSIADELRRQIFAGEFEGEGALPSENEMMEKFGVSRVTVRQSLAILEEQGIIYRQQGRGTFLAPPHLRQQLSRGAKTIVEALREVGIEPKVKVLGVEHIKLPTHVKNLFGGEESEGIKLRRLYSHNKLSIALVTLYLPLSLGGVAYILAQGNNEQETTYSIFEKKMGLSIREAKHIVKTVAIDESEAAVLRLRRGDICLGMDRITYSSQGSVLELMNYIYPPGRMQFEINLPRKNTGMLLKVYSQKTEDRS